MKSSYIGAKRKEILTVNKIILDKDIGKNIRALRKKKNMKQDEIAAKLQLEGVDISRSTYAKIESGNRNVFAKELIALKRILNCTYEQILEGK